MVAAHPLYLERGENDDARRARYQGLFADEIPAAPVAALRDATNSGFVLGSDRFQRQIAAMVGRTHGLANQGDRSSNLPMRIRLSDRSVVKLQ